MSCSVKYSGPWAEASGYAQANRNIIQSLSEVGVDLVTERQVYSRHPTNYGAQYELAASLENKHDHYPIKILHITPNVYSKHVETGRYHIGHLFWETTGMSKEWEKYLDVVDELWTGCEFNKKCFRDAGFRKPIFVFPQPIDTSRSEEPMEIVNAKGFTFYSIFQWIERKNPKSLLQAYWKEFEGNKDVTLVIKTYGLSFDEYQKELIYEDIRKWKQDLQLSSYPRTLIIDYLLSNKQMYQLHNSGDCFVSAHRGEGWGIPQVEALTQGKPVISTNLGGFHEWMPDDAMLKVNYSMVPVFGMKWAEQYTTDQKWAQVNEQHLREKMRWVFDHQEEARALGLKGKEAAQKLFNFQYVGNLMKERLTQIYQEKGLS
jgi:glycosyltransferase involved in cell wall biosynthesis